MAVVFAAFKLIVSSFHFLLRSRREKEREQWQLQDKWLCLTLQSISVYGWSEVIFSSTRGLGLKEMKSSNTHKLTHSHILCHKWGWKRRQGEHNNTPESFARKGRENWVEKISHSAKPHAGRPRWPRGPLTNSPKGQAFFLSLFFFFFPQKSSQDQRRDSMAHLGWRLDTASSLSTCSSFSRE